MISILIYCHSEDDVKWINSLCSYCVALLGEESMCSRCLWEQNSLRGLDEIDIVPELIIYEILSFSDITNLEWARTQFPKAELVIITNHVIPVENYLNLKIRPSTLIMKPYDKQKMIKTIRQMLIYFYQKRQNKISQKKLLVWAPGEKVFFEYARISYIEARNKKIVVHYEGKEYSFYGSLKKIEESLPAIFVRCHRSYILNTIHISRIDLLQNDAYIGEHIVIPISKKYKHNLNNLLDNIYNTTGLKLWEDNQILL